MTPTTSLNVRAGIDVAAYIVVPILGLLLWGWDWRAIVILYWLENLTVGVTTLISVARTRDLTSVLRVVVFAFNYFAFWVGHGIFVLILTVGGGFGGDSDRTPIGWGTILLSWAVASIVQVVVASVSPRAAVESTKGIIGATMARLLALHVAIIAAGLAIGYFGLPAITAILLVVIHAIIQAIGLRGGFERLGGDEDGITVDLTARPSPAAPPDHRP